MDGSTFNFYRMQLWFPTTVVGCFLLFSSCSDKDEMNPFDETATNQDTVNFQLEDQDPNSIAGLFVNVFQTTCANSGCHDGSFEPDYRTLESTYNTMVFQTPIKNDGNYNYRVHPGLPEKSVLMARIKGTIPPIMPFQLDPDSDWLEKRDEYIENIKNWIENGALDITGNAPVENANSAAGFRGMIALQDGQKLTRVNAQESVLVPEEYDTVELYFALSHDEMDVRNFSENIVKFSNHYNDFTQSQEYEMEVLQQPLTDRGMFGNTVEYFHKISIAPADLQFPDPLIFIRLYVKDENNPTTEIPSDEAAYDIKKYLSLALTD